jgi:hypothetical protein
MLGDHEFRDGSVHYTDAYSAYGPIVAGKSGNAARDRHQHWELTTEAMPAALLGEPFEATGISCRPVLEAEDGLADWRYRMPPCTAIAGRALTPAVANSGWCWRAMPQSMAAIRCRPIPASSSAQRIPPLPAPQALSARNCCACNSAAARRIESRYGRMSVSVVTSAWADTTRGRTHAHLHH